MMVGMIVIVVWCRCEREHKCEHEWGGVGMMVEMMVVITQRW